MNQPDDIRLVLSRRQLKGALALAILFGTAYAARSENFTLSTFYPSPTGVYRKLITTLDTILARDGGTLTVGSKTTPAKVDINGSLRLSDGSQALGNVLTSDANGFASWQTLLPSGAVMYFNLAACPSGWSVMTAAQGRYLVGLPANGILGSAVGQALTQEENRPTGDHLHDIPIYQSVSGFAVGLRLQGSSNNASASNVTSGAAFIFLPPGNLKTLPVKSFMPAGTNAPYVELLVCQKN